MSREIGTGLSFAALKARLAAMMKSRGWRPGDEKKAKDIVDYHQESPAWKGWRWS